MQIIKHQMTPNDSFNIYIIFNPELYYEIAVLYPRAYLLILSINIPNCRVVIGGGWFNFSISLKGFYVDVKPL